MRKATKLLRFWFTFEEPVSRRAYLRHGLALMLLKYCVDLLLVTATTRTLWTPLDYLSSAPFLFSSRLSGAERFLAPALAGWTLPFLWIGISMTIRRLLDAGWSAWWSLLFFVPVLNYALLAVLCVAPGRSAPRDPVVPAPSGGRLPSALLAMAFGALVGLAMTWAAVFWIDSYGLALFFGTPFAIGLVTAFLLRRRHPATAWETAEVVVLTLFLVAGAAFAVGLEGAVCLLMAAPLGIIVTLMGGLVGRHLAAIGEAPARGAVLLLVLFPGTAAIEGGDDVARLREVSTSVVIDAPAGEVWSEVIAFSPIPEPTSLLFRLGLAYPMHAEIEGAGVGAVRYCVFSTGAFVEPITAWEPGSRLAFDVIESPRPLEELSPWSVSPPHLEGYLVPRRGEFRLVALPDGRTRLEGSTWYEQRLRPEGYWVVFSDHIIGRIHGRVLEHIKREVEGS